MTFDLRSAAPQSRNMESENYATISGFENLVTFEMQGLRGFTGVELYCFEPFQRKALPGLRARGVMVFAHLGLFLLGCCRKAPEAAGANSFDRAERAASGRR